MLVTPDNNFPSPTRVTRVDTYIPAAHFRKEIIRSLFEIYCYMVLEESSLSGNFVRHNGTTTDV